MDKKTYMNNLFKIDERGLKILELRYGLTDNKIHTLDELACLFGVCRERIRQLEAKTIKHLIGLQRAINKFKE